MNLNLGKKFSYRCLRNKYLIAIFFLTAIAIINPTQATAFSKEELTRQSVFKAILAPANPQNDDDMVNFYYEVKPGGKIEDTILITNFDFKKNNLIIYPTHTITEQEGNIGYSNITDTPQEISNWIKWEDKEIILEPEESRLINFTLEIPDNVEYGEYSGGFAMQKDLIGRTENNASITNSFRKITKIKISVVENPKEFVKKNYQKIAFQNDTKTIVFKPNIYFWIYSVIFILAIGYYLVSYILKQRIKKK
jgi:hypothetical protein